MELSYFISVEHYLSVGDDVAAHHQLTLEEFKDKIIYYHFLGYFVERNIHLVKYDQVIKVVEYEINKI